ncbi:YdeI/OmpD-associated family protein [Lysinibacter cavernae]|uniref:Uncharacterized protein YdeI (YjbR/CyaY-like superfamily) n=1 Tax=Lysinibacter cavernae TaxID=1640652 RepID=A0A7X5R344_9MICO|nr:YdeI/OmpD-associated family protein [Lysinibacter cavernae]NIH54736.1 uncharacterized protein YdeI (YjbR/CyaY-like superfamily) [Lysinibacter cavernae]
MNTPDDAPSTPPKPRKAAPEKSAPVTSPAIEPFVVKDAEAWRTWLDDNEELNDGVWLVLAKKGTTQPTSLSYAQALDEALCSGWIDGQKRSLDAATFLQRFTPRRPRSIWSARNVEHTERLTGEGRMRPRGQTEIDKAVADGRWDRAYKGSSTIEVPEELANALAASPVAAERFKSLTGQNRYAFLHRVTIGRTPELRERAAERLVEKLEQGVTPYEQPEPQTPTPASGS